MAQVLVGGGRTSAITLTQFANPLSGLGGTATESIVATPIRAAGTFSNWGASFDANGTARSLQLRKNSANGNSVLSPADSTAQVVYDTTHTDHFNAADTLDFQYNGTAPAYIPFFISGTFVADSGHVGFACTPAATYSAAAGAARFSALHGEGAGTTENGNITRTTGTVSNYYVNAFTNTSTNIVTVQFRKNKTNGNGVVSVGVGVTGVVEDTTHSDTFVSGDALNWQYTSSGTPALTVQSGCQITYNSTANEVFSGNSEATNSFSASDQFLSLVQSQSALLTTESNGKLQHQFAGSSSHFRAWLSANTLTGSLTAVVRKNGADATQTFSVGAGLTGLFEDTLHVDSFAGTDDFDYAFRGGTSGTWTMAWVMTTEAIDSLMGQSVM